jgi:tetratricopeptide (TPR) repeat protein
LAANKRKILEAARKHAQRGAKDKALKEYQKLLQLDPRDAKLCLEVGDAHRRWGEVDEAVAAYAKVAQQYMKDGFDARAVAVYKQIQNLDPTRYDSYESLAELYQRMGLTAEAINTLQTAADGHHREGRKREALDLLRKMATIDPTNTTSRIKVADLLRQEGLHTEAAAEYREVAAEFERQGDVEALGNILERILEGEPDCIPVVKQLANNLLGRGLADRAEPFAKHALEANPAEPESYELLAQVYRAQNRGDELIDVYRRLADVYAQRGDAERAREIRQRFIPPDGMSAENSGAEGLSQDGSLEAETLHGDVSEFLEESTLVGDASGFLQRSTLAGDTPAGASEEELHGDVSELLDSEFLAGESPSGWNEAGDIEAGGLEGRPADLELPTGEHAAESELVEKTEVALDRDEDVDPEQVLAEASVYLRYGKQEQAIESLERLLEFDPQNRGALEKLGDAFAGSGQSERAVEVWLRAAKRAREDGDEPALGVLRDRIAALDEGAAAALEPEPTPAGDEESQD